MMKQNKYSNSGPPEKNLNFSQMPKQTPKQQKEQELKKQLDEYNKKKLQQGRQDWQEANDANTLDQRNILQGMWNIAQFVDPGISTNIANIGINKLRGTPQEGGDYAGILASLIPYTKYGMKGEKLGKPWIKKLLEYTDKGEDAYNIAAQQYGGEANWLDQYDEEYKYGGMKKLPGARRFTSKNIQSSINTLFSRNHDLFGPAGKKYYSPLVKYFDGGFNQGNALPGATQSTDWSMMANPNAVDYRTQAYPNASNPTMMQGPAAPTVTDKLTPEMGLDYKQKFDNPLFGGGKLANLTRGLMPWVTQLGMQDEYKAMQDKAFASTSANAVFRKDDQKNLGSYTPDTYGINNFRPNQVGMTVFGQGLAYENQNISRYGGESGWLDNY